jgi:hypothetical protein
MTTSKRRLDKIDVSLTPKQAILLWMGQAHQHDTMEQYVRALKDGADSAWHLVDLPEQVAVGVRQALKGQPREEVSRRVRQAVRDVLFLFHLHQQVNRKLMEQQEAFLFRLRWLRAELGRLRYQKMVRQASLSGIRRGLPRRQEVKRWQEEAERFLGELQGLHLAVLAIRKRYFDGHDLLFPALTEGLNYLVKAMEVLVEMFNEDLAPKKGARTDMSAVQARAGTVGTTQVAFLVDMARAEALDHMGETQAAAAIVERRIER